jgi:NAD+ diphosphatase
VTGSRRADAPSRFAFTDIPVLSRSVVARRDDLRDPDDARDDWPRGRLLLLDAAGRAPIDHGDRLAFRDTRVLGDKPPSGAVFVGAYGGVSYWAAHVEAVSAPAHLYPVRQNWADLQGVGAQLSDADCGVFTTALAVLTWQRSAVRCDRCGGVTEILRSGWVRRCGRCNADEYPRTDCAVICLVHDGDGPNGCRVLIGRKRARPPGWASLPAGFVESGESLEAAAVREVQEETGIDIEDVRYLGSQPWPFPRSLLVAFSAIARAGQTPDVGQAGEFLEARWVDRQTVLSAAAGGGADLMLPPDTSIARRMLIDWADAG